MLAQEPEHAALGPDKCEHIPDVVTGDPVKTRTNERRSQTAASYLRIVAHRYALEVTDTPRHYRHNGMLKEALQRPWDKVLNRTDSRNSIADGRPGHFSG
jgi:hypothetical protein